MKDEELKKYRSLKKTGRLIILPENMDDGDLIWRLGLDGNISQHMLVNWIVFTGRLFGKISVDGEEELFEPSDIDRWIFRTREEAEARREKLDELLFWKDGLLFWKEGDSDTSNNREDVLGKDDTGEDVGEKRIQLDTDLYDTPTA